MRERVKAAWASFPASKMYTIPFSATAWDVFKLKRVQCTAQYFVDFCRLALLKKLRNSTK
jgi:hypothetical protein